MDILLGKASRQASALRNDLDNLIAAAGGSTSTMASQQGQFMASMTTFSKTLSDIDEMVKREMSMERRTECKEKLNALRAEQETLKTRFASAKQEQRERERLAALESLVGQRPTPDSFGSTSGQSGQRELTEALLKDKEITTLDFAGQQLEYMMNMGRATLENARIQRGTLKSVQKKVLDGLSSLGVSKNVIQVIERKSAQDRYIFWSGVIITLLVIYFFWRFMQSAPHN